MKLYAAKCLSYAYDAAAHSVGPTARHRKSIRHICDIHALFATLQGRYQDYSLSQLANTYDPPCRSPCTNSMLKGNDPVKYANDLTGMVGVGTGAKLSSLSSAQIMEVSISISQLEGMTNPHIQKHNGLECTTLTVRYKGIGARSINAEKGFYLCSHVNLFLQGAILSARAASFGAN